MTLPAAADEIGVSYRTLLQAVDRGQVRIIEFGSLRRISKAEARRVRALIHGDDAA